MDKEITPAEPEVLWRVPPGTMGGWYAFKILADGSAWSCHPRSGDWIKMDGDRMHPAIRELARRLLAERIEQERLDDHNDKREAEAFAEWRSGLAAEHLKHYIAKLEDELRGRLARLEIAKESLDGRVQELDTNLAREIDQRTLETRELRGSCAACEHDLIATVKRLNVDLNNGRGRVDIMWELLFNNLYHPVTPWRDGREVVGALSVLRFIDQELDWPGPAVAPEAPPADKLSSDAIVLAPIDAPALSWTKENRMVDPDGRVALDLGDYDNLRPEEHVWLSRLVDLWCAWGPEGYLRERLATEPRKAIHWFDQLRSELLAKPWKEGS